MGLNGVLDPLREVGLMAQSPLENMLVIMAGTLEAVVWLGKLTLFAPLKRDDASIGIAHECLT